METTPRPLFRVLAIAAGGLTAQRARMEVAAQNIANAETTRTPEGGPYRRKTVQLEAVADGTTLHATDIASLMNTAIGGAAFGLGAAAPVSDVVTGDPADAGGVRIAGISEDPSQGNLVYDPGHPDANGDGYVRMPNVRITDEMMDMMDARRVYDANATVFQAAKAMLRRALDL
ncbi:MAG: flagellar basal body rod protein FlgC [bacterium]